MQGINKVILVGNVGKDPDIRYLEGGVAVANFPLATNETYRNQKGEKVTISEWHHVVAWRGLAEIVEKFIKKGVPIYVEGRIKTRYWEKEEQRRNVTEVVADNIIILSKRAKDEDLDKADFIPEKEGIENFAEKDNFISTADDLSF